MIRNETIVAVGYVGMLVLFSVLFSFAMGASSRLAVLVALLCGAAGVAGVALGLRLRKGMRQAGCDALRPCSSSFRGGLE